MTGNESKCYRRDANMYSIECRTREKSGGGSGLEGRRSHKAKGLPVQNSGSGHIYWEAFRKMRPDKSVQISGRVKGLAIRRARHI
jgi:hypothetical protein